MYGRAKTLSGFISLLLVYWKPPPSSSSLQKTDIKSGGRTTPPNDPSTKSSLSSIFQTYKGRGGGSLSYARRVFGAECTYVRLRGIYKSIITMHPSSQRKQSGRDRSCTFKSITWVHIAHMRRVLKGFFSCRQKTFMVTTFLLQTEETSKVV